MAVVEADNFSDLTVKKRPHVESPDSVADSPGSKLVRRDPDESGLHSPDADKIREDLLLVMLDDCDEPEIQGLETVIKCFQDEILFPTTDTRQDSLSPEEAASAANSSGSDLDERRSDLGYLLEASDDDLGLPPSTTVAAGSEDVLPIVDGGSGRFDFVVGFDDEIRGFDWMGYEFSEETLIEDDDYDGGFVAVDGLFDYGGEPWEEGFLWRPESLPAL